MLDHSRRDARGTLLSSRTATALAAGLVGLAPVTGFAQGAPSTEPAKTLSEVTVTEKALPSVYGEDSDSYVPRGVEVGKTAQTLREIPQSVTVITRQRMDDQGMKTLDDVMNYTTGVTREETWLDTTYLSRGMAVSNIRFDGGAASSTRSGTRSLDMAQFDSVSLLRGSDGMFGAGEAGGVLNFTYKRPLAKRQTNVLLFGGTMNNYRAELDTTGALNQAGTVRGRLVAVHHDRREMADPSRLKRQLLYGALDFDLGSSTLLTFGASYQKDHNTGFNASLPRYADGSDIGFSRDTNFGAPWNWIDRENTTVFAKLEHQVNSSWTVKAQVRHTTFNEGVNAAEIESAPEPGTLVGADWWIHQSKSRERETSFDLNAQGGFDAWGRRHDVILGLDHHNTNNFNRSLWPRIGPADVFNRVPPADPGYPLGDWESGSQTSTQKTGLYGSVRLRPIENWSVVLGGRYVLQDKSRQHDMDGALTSKSSESHVLVPYAGVIYELSKSTNIYASTAEIYQSQAGKFSAPLPGTPLDPVRGRTYELGIKSQLSKDLLASAALFRTEKKGEGVFDPAYPQTDWRGGCCYFRDGYQQSQGVDLELTGRVTPNLQLAVGYTYNNNEDKRKDNAQFSTITPRHLFKAWADYRMSGVMQGWSLGLGVVAQSSTYRASGISAYNPETGRYDGTWTPYQFISPGYAVWSARLGYVINKDWSLAINVGNLFDKTYYSTVGYAGYGNFYGEKRTVTVSLKGRF
ncbi:MAG: TonB-dependent siderophore receptor [Ottowia sp.]|uniref:TonB-dependent siderophore receptor n=1 Tax=Ottowia sp. TaxID=1898956 RepID=UPI003C760C93